MELKTYILVLTAICAVTAQTRKRSQFRVVYEWNTYDFKWSSNETRDEAISSGKYIKENVIVSGIKPYGDKLYLTLPRMKPGVPATIATVPLNPSANDTSPALEPFPSWKMNEVGDCRAFQSVQSVEIDTKGTMWIIDNGRTSTMKPDNSSSQTCPPTLTLIDLNNIQSSLVRYTFPTSVATDKSYLNDIVIDDTDEGYAYITDNSGMDPGIIVFSKKDSQSWKIRDANSMTAAQNAKRFFVNGTDIDLGINIDGIALGPRYMRPDGFIDRSVYFCPLASYRLYSISASVLRNSSVSTQPAQMTKQLVLDLGMKPSQTDGMIMDEEGFLFYGLVGNYSIAQWDSRLPFNTNQHIIAKDKTYIQWVDRFGFDPEGNLYVMINRLHNFVADKVNVDEVNYRILKSNVGARSYLYGPTADMFTKPSKNVEVRVNVYNNRTSGATGIVCSATTLLALTAISYLCNY